MILKLSLEKGKRYAKRLNPIAMRQISWRNALVYTSAMGICYPS